MFRWWISAVLGTAFSIAFTGCRASIPDLSAAEAAEIISREPKFNQYARIGEVQELFHAKKPMDFAETGKFTFRYLTAGPDSAPVLADVQFRYHEGKWYLHQFDYGCPNECHFIYVYDGPARR
jgi:hypothetical protein